MADRAPHTLPVAFPTATPHALNGRVELALAQALCAPTRPGQVSAVLGAMFSHIGGLPVTQLMVEQLATGARAWLLARAALVFMPGTRWFQASCGACGQAYDLSISLADFPRSDIPTIFPVIEIKTSQGPRRFEVPNGATELALAHANTDTAPRVLAACCGLDEDAQAQATTYTPADLELIDAALDAATPDIPDTLTTNCPSCEAQTQARIDPLSFAFPGTTSLLRQIHLLAKTYQWSEATILDMPTYRRTNYAQMIAQEVRA